MAADIHIGTSGWAYKQWRGVFYPETLPGKKWFEYYAQHFSTAELNNTFYRLPIEKAVENWRESSPPDFLSAAKGKPLRYSHKKAQGVQTVYAYFSNDAGGHAIKNAEQLRELLG